MSGWQPIRPWAASHSEAAREEEELGVFEGLLEVLQELLDVDAGVPMRILLRSIPRA
jgi:hypothetical protein